MGFDHSGTTKTGPLSGVTVWLVREANTDDGIDFWFDTLPPGEYRLAMVTVLRGPVARDTELHSVEVVAGRTEFVTYLGHADSQHGAHASQNPGDFFPEDAILPHESTAAANPWTISSVRAAEPYAGLEGTGQIRGVVRYADAAGRTSRVNAVVALIRTTTSDATGHYTFSTVAPSSAYELAAFKSGFAFLSGGRFEISPGERMTTDINADAVWPSYRALDYRKPGHPHLRAAQVAELRAMLSRLKPCQRRFLYYAFPDPQTSAEPFVMFFWPYAGGGRQPHVLGGDNLYYDVVEGHAFPTHGMPDESLADEIRDLGCPAGDVIPD